MRGFAHVGVLKVLDQTGFVINGLAGSSIGALIGAAYCLGKSPDSIEQYLKSLDQSELFASRAGQRAGLRGVEGVRRGVKEVFGDARFSDLKIPFAANAVDISTGELLEISDGSLEDAVMASISLPGIFPPGRWQGRHVFDGGVINSNPVSLARALSPDLPVVAVVLSKPLSPWPRPSPIERLVRRPFFLKILRKSRFYASMDYFIRSFEIISTYMTKMLLERDQPDVIIRPQTHHLDTLQHVDIDEVIGLGESAARAMEGQLFSLKT